MTQMPTRRAPAVIRAVLAAHANRRSLLLLLVQFPLRFAVAVDVTAPHVAFRVSAGST